MLHCSTSANTKDDIYARTYVRTRDGGKSRQKAERKQTRPASTRPKSEPYRRPRAGIGRGTRIVMSKAHARQPSRERISKCSCLLFVHSRISRIAIDRSIDGRGIPVALCAARKEKSPPAPARMPIYSNERTNELGIAPRIVLLGRSDFT